MAKENNNMDNIRQRSHKGVDNIMDSAQNVADKGKEHMVYLKESAMRAKENIDSYIRINPERSVLIASGIGAIVGASFVAIFMKRKHYFVE